MFFCQFRARRVLTRISHRLSIGVGLSAHCWCAASDIACRGECNNSRYHNVTATPMAALPSALTLCMRAVSLELGWFFSFRLINALSGTCQCTVSYVGANWSWFVRIASGPSGWRVNLCSDREHRLSAVRSEWCELASVWPCRAWRRKTNLRCRWRRWLTGRGRRRRARSSRRPRRLLPSPTCGSCNRHLLPITCPPLIVPWICNVNIDKISLIQFLGALHYIENQFDRKKEMNTGQQQAAWNKPWNPQNNKGHVILNMYFKVWLLIQLPLVVLT